MTSRKESSSTTMTSRASVGANCERTLKEGAVMHNDRMRRHNDVRGKFNVTNCIYLSRAESPTGVGTPRDQRSSSNQPSLPRGKDELNARPQTKTGRRPSTSFNPPPPTTIVSFDRDSPSGHELAHVSFSTPAESLINSRRSQSSNGPHKIERGLSDRHMHVALDSCELHGPVRTMGKKPSISGFNELQHYVSLSRRDLSLDSSLRNITPEDLARVRQSDSIDITRMHNSFSGYDRKKDGLHMHQQRRSSLGGGPPQVQQDRRPSSIEGMNGERCIDLEKEKRLKAALASFADHDQRTKGRSEDIEESGKKGYLFPFLRKKSKSDMNDSDPHLQKAINNFDLCDENKLRGFIKSMNGKSNVDHVDPPIHPKYDRQQRRHSLSQLGSCTTGEMLTRSTERQGVLENTTSFTRHHEESQVRNLIALQKQLSIQGMDTT